MTVVVSDTSPINYLLLLGKIDLLPQLFGTVVVPPAVVGELASEGAPAVVSAWVKALPHWVIVEMPHRIDETINLDPGESEAISLAVERRISVLLIDERRGTRAAKARGIVTVGTLNIIEQGAAAGLIEFDNAISALVATNFRVSPTLVDEARSRLAAKLKSGSSPLGA